MLHVSRIGVNTNASQIKTLNKGKGKGEVHTRTGHVGPEG